MEPLVHALLSNALVATGLAAIPLALARAGRSPAVVHALWLVVLIKLVTPPLFLVPLTIPERSLPGVVGSRALDVRPPASAVAVPVLDVPDESAPAEDLLPAFDPPRQIVADRAQPEALPWPPWEVVVLAAILCGSLLVWTLAAVRVIRARRLLGVLRPAPDDLQERVEDVAARLGLRRAPRAYLAPGRIPPMLWALGGRTRLLLPSDLWNALDPEQRTTLLAHELAHLKRGDPLVRWFDLFVAGLYWWHPIVSLARRGLREAEELCCDAWAVWAVPRGSRTYAAALLAALDFVSGAPAPDAAATLAVISSKRHVQFLTRRMRMIVQATTPRAPGLAARLALFGLAALVLPLAPTWGQSPDAPPGRDRHEQLARKDVAPDVRPDADGDDDDRDAKDRTAQLESLLKDLGEKLGKDLEPIAQEVAKALEKAAKEVGESIDKDGVISKDLRQALEKARDELHESFKSGGPLDKQARESAEKARRNMRDAVEKARDELHAAVRERADKAREEAERRGLLPGSDGDVKDGDSDRPADLERARRDVREMEAQLRRAMRRLEALERRQQRPGRAARREGRPADRAPAPPAPPEAPAPPDAPDEAKPAPPAPPEPPGRPDGPRGLRGPGGRGPGGRGPGMAGPGGPPVLNPRVERRLHELEEKMDRLLKELEGLKGGGKDKAPQGGRVAS